MSILTKVVVFGSDADSASSGVQIFADDAANINADGSQKSEFYPGDNFYFLVIVPADIKLLSVQSTDGTVSLIGAVVREKKDQLLFADTAEPSSLSQTPIGPVTTTWYGRTAVLTVDKQQVTVNTVPSIADLSYKYAALQYRLTAPAYLPIGSEEGANWPIGIVVYAEVVV